MNLPPWFACGCGMDTIPYEYYSFMRIWDGRQDVLVLGHWEYCPEGAQVIPFLHPYQSHFWDDERLPEADPLGEVPLVLGRWKGTRNARYTGQCFIGSEEDWNAGAGYDTRPNLEVDEEDIPIGCCTLPIGTDGHYYPKWKRERAWSVLVRTGDRKDASWNRERSWRAVVKTSAHYAALWNRERSWRAVYETTDHFAASWNRERSWQAVVKTSAHYAVSWNRERSWNGVYETTDHFAATWNREKSWQAVVTTSAHYAVSWNRERSWQAVVTTSAHHAASWNREHSWNGVYETTDHFAASWNHERSWQAVVKTSAHYAATWNREKSWQALIKTSAHYAASWNREQSWSVAYATMNNVTSFDCGTIVAAGTTQGTATAIANDTVSATSTGAGQGIILPAGCYRVCVRNANAPGGNAIKVYPPTSASISGNAPNTGVSLAAASVAIYCEVTGTLWVTVAAS